MLLNKSKILSGLVMGMLLCGIGTAQQVANPQWKDRAEFDLVEEVKKAAGAKKIELLDQWKQKYPDTDFKTYRAGQYVSTYLEMKKLKEMYVACQEYNAIDPKDFLVTTYLVQMAPGQNDTEGAIKAANQLEGLLDDPKLTPAQKTGAQNLIRNTRYAIVRNKKNPAEFEPFLREGLDKDPSIAAYSYDLGTLIIGKKKPELYPEAFWQFARAAGVTGTNALPEANKKQALDYLIRIYTQYKGSKKGLDKLLADSLTATYAPKDFAIKTDQQEILEQEEELKKTNPQLALWIAVKKALIDTGGEEYFKTSVKDAAVPPMKGKVLSMKPATKPKEIVVAVADATTPEITIIIADGGSLPGTAEPGTEIEFEAVAKAFTKEPFMMTVEVESNKIKGWPTPIPAATGGAKKAAPAVKKAIPKKK